MAWNILWMGHCTLYYWLSTWVLAHVFNNMGLLLLTEITKIGIKITSWIFITAILKYSITMTSQWTWWRLRSPASRLFTQPFIQTQIRENIKAPRHWPLCGEFTGDRWIPRTNGQLRGKCFHLMTSSWDVIIQSCPSIDNGGLALSRRLHM